MKSIQQIASLTLGVAVCGASATLAQEPAEKPAARPKASPASEGPLPAQFTLLETQVRFEANGDSRKEVHAVVKITNELGVRQFGRLNFDFNRSFQNVEIPLVRITHASGGTADILPSAISDEPNPAVVNFPAYQDVRVKSVRILGLAPNDTLDYRVITATSHAPLAPDFWFEHTFDRSGVVSREDLTVELPPALGSVDINPKTPAETTATSEGGRMYHWQRKQEPSSSRRSLGEIEIPDVKAGSFATEVELAYRLAKLFYPGTASASAVEAKARELTEGTKNDEARVRALYSFVSKKIVTVDLPVGATGFHLRAPEEVLSSGAATLEDKAMLLVSLVQSVTNFAPSVCFAFQNQQTPPDYSLPAEFQYVLLEVAQGILGKALWMDPGAEVAPLGMISRVYRNKPVLCLARSETEEGLSLWEAVPDELPFVSSQRVTFNAALNESGTLTAKAKYTMRGDNELLLRVAFHKTPKENWKSVAQLLALSDGFRGRIGNVTASDPLRTDEPFAVEYEITQPKFLDWAKKPVRIPALLPVLGLPDPPGKASRSAPHAPIELGTPLEVEVTAMIHLPEGTGAEVPAGTSVERDFATYKSQYSVNGATVTASRHINFILREIPAERAAEYNAFLHAVQNDESQTFRLERGDGTTAPRKP